MNKLPARVTCIQGEQNLHIISFEGEGYALKMMGLDLPMGLHVDSQVILGAKPSHMAIAKNFSGELSYSNQIQGKITQIEMGQLLCNVCVDVQNLSLKSMITAASAERLRLKEGDVVTLLIKASELFVLEVVNV